MATHNLRCIAFFFLLTIVSGVTSFLTQNQFNRVIGKYYTHCIVEEFGLSINLRPTH